MADFDYLAIDTRGQEQRGHVAAADADAARGEIETRAAATASRVGEILSALDATAASMSSPWRLRRHMPQKETGIRPRPHPSAVHCGGEEGTRGRGVSHQ